ncbi:MAG TPA: RNA polymerase sigma factor [Candidatus Polarisedimenticolia bacterium]|nr:RNA polymerase sigma factor [Candidatus Polarisedimenticolia bacterium]
MRYPEKSIAARLLEDDPEAIGVVIRWISSILTWPRFWSLREEWPDLVQETLARVIESLQKGRFDAARDFRFYVQGIARHTAVRAVQEVLHRRLESEKGKAEALAAVLGTPVVDVVAARQIVRRVLDQASEECRLLIRLYFLDEKGYEEIGQELLVPVGTVKSRLSRCLMEAQKALRVAVRRHLPDAKVESEP